MSKATKLRWIGLGVLALAFAGWLASRPDPQVEAREKTCRSYGITDPTALTKCRESDEGASAATKPIQRAIAERDIADFNSDLAGIASGQTHATNPNYPEQSLDAVAAAAGGVFGMVFGNIDEKNTPALGQAVKVSGVIVTNDPNDERDGTPTEPRHFTIEEELKPGSLRTNGEGDPIAPATINIDIESLNRYERQFIVDHCGGFPSVTPCRATVLGRVGEIIGRSKPPVRYVGVIVDEADIQSLDSNTAFLDGMPSDRAIIEQRGYRPVGAQRTPR